MVSFFSLKLWLVSRLYPVTPVLPAFKPFPAPWDSVSNFLRFLTAAGRLCKRRKTGRSRDIVSLFVLVLLQDQSRWQPCAYQYCSCFGQGLARISLPSTALNSCRLIVAMIYIWSGVAKLNPGFVSDMFPWLLEPFTHGWPVSILRWIEELVFIVPFVECGLWHSIADPAFSHRRARRYNRLRHSFCYQLGRWATTSISLSGLGMLR